VSVISIAEVRRGIYLLSPGKRRTDLEFWFERYLPLFNTKTLPVTEAIASRWARMSALRQQKGIPLSVTDGLIAATAFEHGLTLATRNTKDFVDLGVPLFNPWGY
jgi:predicted nucleic acid-binding protein